MKQLRNWSTLLLAALALSSCGSNGDGDVTPPPSGGSTPVGWVPTFGDDLDSDVVALHVFDDGGGSALYAGGFFTTAGGAAASRVAQWDGALWSPLGGGFDDAVVTLESFDDGGGLELYAAGPFTVADGQGASFIARWDGAAWSPLGTGLGAFANALEVYDDGLGGGPALYAGGFFTTAGGAPANYIARWDGAAWSALGSGADNSVSALAVFDDGTGPALFAAGLFASAGGVPASFIAKWDGATWAPLGTGMDNSIGALAVFDDGTGQALYAGGFFTTADGAPASRIAKWDGAAWSALGSGVNDAVRTLVVHDDGSSNGPALYAAGNFTSAGGVAANRIAKWDGTSWSALGAGVPTFNVFALAVFDDGSSTVGVPNGPSLFAGGNFTTSPGGDAFLAKWGRSSQAVLVGAQSAALLTTEGRPCALTERLGEGLRLDDPAAHLVLDGAHVQPLRGLEWLAGTIELRGGTWRQSEALVLGVSGPARLLLSGDARLEVPRVIVGAQGELSGAGFLLGDLENTGRVTSTGTGLHVGGRYLSSPPGTLNYVR